MTNYNIKLTPQLINLATEGSLDSSILNGKSYQRTFNMFEVENGGNRKMISAKDGDTFNDTTFQNSNGIGTFEAVNFAFDPNYVGYFIELSNNNSTASFTSDADEDESTVLTNYAIKSGEKVVFSMVTTYGNYEEYTGVGIANHQFDFNDFLGADTNSIGFYDNGNVYFEDDNLISLDLSFQQNGNVVDVAVDRVNNLIWFRVDGGDWNSDNAQNPETTSGGIDISSIPGDAYPGACPYSYDGVFGQISINNSISNPPLGFKVLVGSEARLVFTASQILDAADSYDQNGFVGAGAIIAITPEQAVALNSYGYPSLYFSAVWAAGSENVNAALNIFAINGMNYGEAFVDVAVIVPFNAENMEPYCTEPTTWNMPVTITGFIEGNNNTPFIERASDPHIIQKLFKQVVAQQEIDLEGKTPQEKADLIRVMLENLDDDHPLVVNMRNRK